MDPMKPACDELNQVFQPLTDEEAVLVLEACINKVDEKEEPSVEEIVLAEAWRLGAECLRWRMKKKQTKKEAP